MSQSALRQWIRDIWNDVEHWQQLYTLSLHCLETETVVTKSKYNWYRITDFSILFDWIEQIYIYGRTLVFWVVHLSLGLQSFESKKDTVLPSQSILRWKSYLFKLKGCYRGWKKTFLSLHSDNRKSTFMSRRRCDDFDSAWRSHIQSHHGGTRSWFSYVPVENLTESRSKDQHHFVWFWNSYRPGIGKDWGTWLFAVLSVCSADWKKVSEISNI